MDNAIAILSGGLDSAVSTDIARQYHNVKMAITFDYGQRAAAQEIRAAKVLCNYWGADHRVIEFKLLSELGTSALTHKAKKLPHLNVSDIDQDKLATLASAEQVWVPNRNGVFINITAAIAEAENFQWIIVGFNREEAETFPDNSPRFIDATNSCLAQSTLSQPQVISYVKEMDKTEILKQAVERNVPVDKLWSCYDGLEKWCGLCESCARTIRAMQHLDLMEKFRTNFL